METGASDKKHRPWLAYFPPATWLTEYQPSWLAGDVTAGITLAAYAVPVSLAYASLAGLPPQVGVYGYMLGGLGYALLGSSRQLAVGPTSAISLMIAATVAPMAAGDMVRYAQIATLAGFVVALLCLIAWLLRLSVLVRLISDSILVGFKAGAALTIIMSQLPSLLGVGGGGQFFFERAVQLAGQLSQTNYLVLIVGIIAIAALLVGDRLFPGRPFALGVVVVAIAAASLLGLPALGVPTVGNVPAGLPSIRGPDLRLRDVEGILPLAAGCLVLAYVESVSAARTFAAKYQRTISPRQEFLGLGLANLAAALGQGYPVAGGLSQSAVNDKAGARTPLALVVASISLAICLLFLTGLIKDLPKAILGAIVFTAVLGMIDIPTLLRMWRISKLDFYAAVVSLCSVLVFGILEGILLATLISVLILLARASQPHVAFLGRIPGTDSFSDMSRHPENQPLPGIIAFRPEVSLLYVNADSVLERVLARLGRSKSPDVRLVICDLSASPYIDLAGSQMLHRLHSELATRGIELKILGARGRVRDLLRSDGVGDKVGGLRRLDTFGDLLKTPA